VPNLEPEVERFLKDQRCESCRFWGAVPRVRLRVINLTTTDMRRCGWHPDRRVTNADSSCVMWHGWPQ
jgi:hypothetical protein